MRLSLSSFPSRKSLEKLTKSQRVNTVFIQELTARAHLRSLASRRRMISRADVAAAVSRSDMFDFLIVRRRRHRCRSLPYTAGLIRLSLLLTTAGTSSSCPRRTGYCPETGTESLPGPGTTHQRPTARDVLASRTFILCRVWRRVQQQQQQRRRTDRFDLCCDRRARRHGISTPSASIAPVQQANSVFSPIETVFRARLGFRD